MSNDIQHQNFWNSVANEKKNLYVTKKQAMMKILNKIACWFNTKWGWFFTNGYKAYYGQAARRGEVHYEIGNGWAGWFVVETVHDPKRKQVECYYHPLHSVQEGKFEQGQTVFFILQCDSSKECGIAWITGLC